MATCDACDDLIGKRAERSPHESLMLINTEAGSQRNLESWLCKDCWTNFFRFSEGGILAGDVNLGVWEKR